MEDFDIIIEGKRIRCTKMYVESVEPVDHTDLKKLSDQLQERFLEIDKGDPNYQRMHEFFLQSKCNKS